MGCPCRTPPGDPRVQMRGIRRARYEIPCGLRGRAVTIALRFRCSGRVAIPARQPRLDTSPVISDEVKTTTCYMCACRCGIKVHLKDGAVRFIEGNRDHPVNRGVLCAKGSAGIMQPGGAGPAAQAAETGRRARRRRVRGDRVGRGAGDRRRVARRHPPDRPAEARLLHRPRPVPGADRLVGQPVRHPELRRPWRLLLGQHGGRRALHHRRLVLGVRRAGLGAHALFHDVRHGRGP